MRLPILGLITLAALSAPARGDDESTPILTSDDLSQIELVGLKPDSLSIQDKVIRLAGKPNGYFATRDSYRNYVLKFDWMYERPAGLKDGEKFGGNSGVLVHISGPHKVWPKCVEVQGENANAGHIFAINGAKFAGKTDRAAQKKAIKPVGEWNEEEIVCKDGAITCSINGVVVSSGTGASPAEGSIGFQSEGAPIRFRALRIKKLD